MLMRNDTHGAAVCWDLIRRGVLTHDALPDGVYDSLVVHFDLVREAAEAYGYTDEQPRRYKPTPRDVSNMLTVWGWLAALKRDPGTGRRDFKLLVLRARDVPWGMLADRWGKCTRTVRRWHDAAVCRVYLANRDEVMRLAA